MNTKQYPEKVCYCSAYHLKMLQSTRHFDFSNNRQGMGNGDLYDFHWVIHVLHVDVTELFLNSNCRCILEVCSLHTHMETQNTHKEFTKNLKKWAGMQNEPSTTPHEWNPTYLDPTHAEATVLERCRNWSGYSTGHFEGCLHLYKYPKVVALVSPNYLLEQRSCQMLSGRCQSLGNCLHYIKIHQCKFSNLDNSNTCSMSMSEDETWSQINSDETYLFWEGNICISSTKIHGNC
jgi:hypothetical protein